MLHYQWTGKCRALEAWHTKSSKSSLRLAKTTGIVLYPISNGPGSLDCLNRSYSAGHARILNFQRGEGFVKD